MHALLNVAVMAARRAGNLLMRQLNHLDKIKVETKGHNDFVSEADRAAEDAVIEDHPQALSGPRDIRGGVGSERRIRHGLDHRPARRHDQLPARFPCLLRILLACRSAAAWNTASSTTRPGRNCLPHRAAPAPSSTDVVSGSAASRRSERALIGTGFPFRQSDVELGPYLDMLGKVVRSTSGVRRPGAAALDLCYVAAGRLDGFWETGLSPWDLAAGSLIIREAGGIVSGLDGSEKFLETGHILTGTPKDLRRPRQTLLLRDQSVPNNSNGAVI